MQRSIKINILLDEELFLQIDEACKAQYQNRSDYIRQAVLERMKRDFERYQRSLQ